MSLAGSGSYYPQNHARTGSSAAVRLDLEYDSVAFPSGQPWAASTAAANAGGRGDGAGPDGLQPSSPLMRRLCAIDGIARSHLRPFCVPLATIFVVVTLNLILAVVVLVLLVDSKTLHTEMSSPSSASPTTGQAGPGASADDASATRDTGAPPAQPGVPEQTVRPNTRRVPPEPPERERAAITTRDRSPVPPAPDQEPLVGGSEPPRTQLEAEGSAPKDPGRRAAPTRGPAPEGHRRRQPPSPHG